MKFFRCYDILIDKQTGMDTAAQNEQKIHKRRSIDNLERLSAELVNLTTMYVHAYAATCRLLLEVS
eukprot:1159320-Pelagomonas_calceolata.AAC.4